jgi:hypothetical protein
MGVVLTKTISAMRHQFGLREISGHSVVRHEAAGVNVLCTKGLRIKNTRGTKYVCVCVCEERVASACDTQGDKRIECDSAVLYAAKCLTR